MSRNEQMMAKRYNVYIEEKVKITKTKPIDMIQII